MEWYRLMDGASMLSQGDIIIDCPIIFPGSSIYQIYRKDAKYNNRKN